MAEIDPVPDPNEPPPQPDAEPELSLAEHEAEFGSSERRPESDPNPPPEEDIRRPPRDRDDQGKFVKPEKPERHRAKSQDATAADAAPGGRIATLTKKLREAEAERDALRARPVAGGPSAAPPAPVSRETPAPASERDWNREVAQYKGLPGFPKTDSFMDYEDAMMAQKLFIDEVKLERAQKEAETAKLTASWNERLVGARARHADFDEVALKTPTTIPQGSLIDAWILEDTSGADVLYQLQKDPAELRRILALPLFEQVKALSLIAQRLSEPPAAAVRTGAAPRPALKVAPRPPTPVRTSAVPARDEPPDYETEDVSLAEHEKWFGRQRR